MILSTTLLIVIVTVIINGGPANSVLKWLGIPTGVLEDQAEGDPIVNSPLHDGYNSIDEDHTNRKNAGNNNESYARMSSVTSGGSEIGKSGSRKPGKSWLAKQWAGLDTSVFTTSVEKTEVLP